MLPPLTYRSVIIQLTLDMLRKWTKFPVSIPLSHWCIISHFTASEMIPTEPLSRPSTSICIYQLDQSQSPKQIVLIFGKAWCYYSASTSTVSSGVQAEENILTRCLKTRCTDLILVFWYRGYAWLCLQSGIKPQFLKQWPMLEPAFAKWDRSLEHGSLLK